MKKNRQNGFTLLEILLTVGVLAASLLLITRLFEDSARSALYEKNTVYFDTVMNASREMVSTISEFDTLYAILQRPAVAGVMEVPLTNDPANVGVNPFNISVQTGAPLEGIRQSFSLSNMNISEISPVQTTLTVVFQILDNIADPNDERSIGVFVAGLDPLREQEVRSVASALGAGGGYISSVEELAGSCLPAGCVNTIRSIDGAWQIDARSFAGTRFANQLAATPASAVNGGYVVSFRFISESEIAGDYLYRLPQLGNTDLNTMNVPIEMSGNNLVGVDNLTIDGNLELEDGSALFAKGSIFSAGRLSMEGGDVFVSGDTEINTLTIGPSYDDAGLNIPSRNQINVENTLTSTNLEIGNNLVSDTGTITNDLLAPSIRTNTSVVNTIDATNSIGVFSTTSQTTNMNVSGVARTGASVSTTNALNVNGNSGALEVLSQGATALNQGVNADFVRFNSVDINVLEQCLAGC